MHFSAPFIRRPVATFLMSVAVILAGAVAYTLLPVASLPQVEFPVISVGANRAVIRCSVCVSGTRASWARTITAAAHRISPTPNPVVRKVMSVV